MYYLILLIFTIFSFCNNKLLAQAQNLTELGENWTKNIINNNENSTSFCEMVYYISDQQKNISLYSISPEEFISLSNTFYSFNLSNEDITNIITSAINFKNTSQGSIYNNLSVIDTIIKIISEDQPNLELLINLSNLKDVSKNILRFINSEKFNNVYNQKKLENQANKDYWNMAFDYYFLINKEITRIHNDKNIYDSLSQDKSSIFAPNIQANELCIYLVNSLTHNKKSLTLEDFQTIPNYTEWLKVNLNINQQSNSTKVLKK